jgi:hypothetical protein
LPALTSYGRYDHTSYRQAISKKPVGPISLLEAKFFY